MATKGGKVVAVLNMKGGVGKTTISAHVMRVLYYQKKIKVLLIDLDPQFNLSQTLLTRTGYDALRKANKTVFSTMEPEAEVSLFNIATTKQPPPKPSDIVTRLRQSKIHKIHLDLLAGDFRLVKYSLIDDRTKLQAAQKRFEQFVSSAKMEYDLIVIDCNPSSSFITLCALHVATEVLVPVRPDRYSMLGLEILNEFIDGLPDLHPKPKLSVLLNGVPSTGYDDTVENELRAHLKFGPLILGNRLRRSKLLEASADYTGFATEKGVAYSVTLKGDIGDITDELSTRWDL